MTVQTEQQQTAHRREAPEAMTEAMVDAAAAAARGAPAAPPDPVDWWTERLVDAGELEAAVAAALASGRDAPPAAVPLRRLTLAAARGLAVAHRAARARTAAEAERDAAALARAHGRLAAAAHLAAVAVRDAAGALGDEVAVGASPGFADGGLYPETYAAAARQLAARVGPARALVVGLGGAGGAGLSAVVADTLARRGVEVRSVAVAAEDAAGDADPAAALDALLRAAAAAPGTWAAVVDERADVGGAPFAGAAAALARRGFDPARVALFPSWSAAAAAAAAAQRGAGPRHFVASFDDVVLGAGEVRCHVVGPDCRLEEVAGGAAHPGARAFGARAIGARAFRCAAHHAGDGPVRLTFAGLGRYGRERAAAAGRLADAGEGPRVLELRRGYLVTADAAAPRPDAGRDG